MSDQAFNAIAAIVLGTGAAILLLIPTAAVQYRKDGRLGPGDLATLVGAAVYLLALWTYTLLPFPARARFRCKQARLDILGSFRPVFDRGLLAPAQLVHDRWFLQIALNVLLFLPLGFFVRLVLHRGVVVTTLLGLAFSLAIETTQLTGVWGLFRCAYREFDVDDLIVNTLGALVGGLLAWLFLHRHRRDDVDRLPTRITLGRRWVGFVSDALFVGLSATASVIAWRAWSHLVRGVAYADISHRSLVIAQLAVPLAVESALVLGAGRTVGEWVVMTRAVSGRLATPLARPVKLVLGVGGFTVCLLVPFPGSHAVLAALVLTTLLASLRSREHRGLTHVVTGMRLTIGSGGSAS